MSMRIVFLFLFFTSYVSIFAQGTPQILTNLAHDDGRSGKIELVQPERMENLLMMHILNNSQQEGIPGYRIRIFSQSGQAARQNANNTRASFMTRFPEIEAYQEYNIPNFQIFVGDFRTKNEALREMRRIERVFPGVFIAPTIIDISK